MIKEAYFLVNVNLQFLNFEKMSSILTFRSLSSYTTFFLLSLNGIINYVRFLNSDDHGNKHMLLVLVFVSSSKRTRIKDT